MSFRLKATAALFVSLLTAMGAGSQQTASIAVPAVPLAPSAARPAVDDSLDLFCGDTISDALHNSTPDMPCWADLRSADRWHASRIPQGELLHPAEENGQQSADYNRASIAGGFLQGTGFVKGNNALAYGGIVAGAFTAGRQRWQLSVEDIGGLADFHVASDNALVGSNLGTVRLRAEITPRLLLQARATNSFGTDAFRRYTPLDERVVGLTQAPVIETASYGLHAGNVLDQQDDAELRYAYTRRTTLEFTAAHSLLKYFDFGDTVQTLRGRAQVLHAISSSTTAGFFGTVATQTSDHQAVNLNACSLAGGGLAAEIQRRRIDVNVSGGIASATSGCGRTVHPIGNLGITAKVTPNTAMFVTLDRNLSGGVILRSPMLSSAAVGVRHTFPRGVGLQIEAGGLLGSDAATRHYSSNVFADAGLHFRIGRHLIQDTSIRRFQNAALDRIPGSSGGQTTLTFSLWLTRDGAERTRD